MANYYSSRLKTLNFDDDICAYFNMTGTTKFDLDNLTGKFDVLDRIGDTNPIEWVFRPMIHQAIVAKCAYLFKIGQMASDTYRDSVLIRYSQWGFFSPILPWVIVPGLVSFVSVLLNISLITITIANMKGHKVCNWLLALDSWCQLFVVWPFLVNLVSALFRLHPVDYRICLATVMGSTVGSFASFLAIYLISLERLLIVIFPLKMNQWTTRSKVRKHSIIAAILCTLFGLTMSYTIFNVWTIINLPYQDQLYCNSGLYADVLNTPVSYTLLLISVLNYVAIFSLLLWRHLRAMDSESTATNDQIAMRRMLRSVFLLAMVVLMGWLVASAARNQITNFVKLVLPPLVALFADQQSDQDRIFYNINTWLITLYTCVPILASASGAPILFFSSSEYRVAYRNMVKINKTTASVGPLFQQNINAASK